MFKERPPGFELYLIELDRYRISWLFVPFVFIFSFASQDCCASPLSY